ncbi:MAG: TetR/AcrR family transcriptional regulator [Acidimicrobiales bacterium]
MATEGIAGSDGRNRSPAARRIMAAADELFFSRGAAATTVREITAACGLTPGALYNHFDSKEDLLFELVIGRHLLLAAKVDAALREEHDDPAARLAAVVRVFVRVHTRPGARQGARVANREYRSLGPARRAQVVAVRRTLRNQVRDVLAEGVGRGTFSLAGGGDSTSATLAASAIIDMCVHATEWLRADGPLTLNAVEDRYVEMALRMAGVR